MIWLHIFVCAYLYRLGGGDIWPFVKGCKQARRYILPIYIALATNTVLTPLVFCLITHFNLKEIEQRRWDDIVCYGLAQAWCFYAVAGAWSALIALWWIVGVFLSNIGIPYKMIPLEDFIRPTPYVFRLDWKYVELGQGAVIGLLISRPHFLVGLF